MDLSWGKNSVRRLRAYRRRQRAQLRESNRIHREDEHLEHSLLQDVLGDEEQADAGGTSGPGDPATAGTAPADVAADARGATQFGEMGRPMNRRSPFYLGFVGALGALIAIGLWHSLGRLATTITILIVALFLTLALNPMVEWLGRRGMKRALAVGLVFLGVLVVFFFLGMLVVPPVLTQGQDLIAQAPNYLDRVLNTRWVQELDKNYDIVDKAQAEMNKRLTDETFISSVLGGVLGAGRAVLNGVFQTFTILILTLYFLSSLPKMKRAAYSMVPASRRNRVVQLSEEIMRRTGSYATGQVAIATVNAILSYVMMTVLGIPYAAVLAVVVGFLGLIPMVGATLGAAVVCLVAFFTEPKLALFAGIYYLVYQQFENYVIAPRIMQRTVSVPGAVTVVAALAGGTLLGVLGALLAIPVAAAALLLVDEVIIPRQRHQ
ncbi:putative PurR-regulated permease PerM [Knoellia remsis]|uniref:Putative PurR-regulated permease PerM n=1 Tax=Knoellia remsis TaxID=407159 RepID=A0A2T0UYF8_9MICO|nr:AI-2E family transporter [Knoellia remsis]PRY62887.1 putative PurR-regulated permease PerM [Knoellia remsis]